MNKPISIDLFRELASDLDTNYWINRRRMFFYIVQIGVGGNGSYIMQQTSQMMKIFDIDGFMLLADADVVESRNLNNQLFIERDLGEKKAVALANRYGTHYNLDIATYDNQFVESVKQLEELFSHTDYIDCHGHDTMFMPILIGSVDNNFSRKIMHEFFMKSKRLLYIDVGCESAKVPRDGRQMDNWTDDEKKAYRVSGYTGQVVCGLRLDGETILEPVASQFPDILEDNDEIAPSEASCQQVVVSDPQRLVTNRMAAMSVYPYLNELFECGTISNHRTMFHGKKGYMRSFPITLGE